MGLNHKNLRAKTAEFKPQWRLSQFTKPTLTTSTMNTNVNQLCFCENPLQKVEYHSCVCCCKKYEENEIEFYECDRGSECQYEKISTVDYMICSDCFNTKDNNGSNIEKNEFISHKTRAAMTIIS